MFPKISLLWCWSVFLSLSMAFEVAVASEISFFDDYRKGFEQGHSLFLGAPVSVQETLEWPKRNYLGYPGSKLGIDSIRPLQNPLIKEQSWLGGCSRRNSPKERFDAVAHLFQEHVYQGVHLYLVLDFEQERLAALQALEPESRPHREGYRQTIAFEKLRNQYRNRFLKTFLPLIEVPLHFSAGRERGLVETNQGFLENALFSFFAQPEMVSSNGVVQLQEKQAGLRIRFQKKEMPIHPLEVEWTIQSIHVEVVCPYGDGCQLDLERIPFAHPMGYCQFHQRKYVRPRVPERSPYSSAQTAIESIQKLEHYARQLVEFYHLDDVEIELDLNNPDQRRDWEYFSMADFLKNLTRTMAKLNSYRVRSRPEKWVVRSAYSNGRLFESNRKGWESIDFRRDLFQAASLDFGWNGGAPHFEKAHRDHYREVLRAVENRVQESLGARD